MNQEQLVYMAIKSERQERLVLLAKAKLYAAITNEEDYEDEIRKGLIEAAIWDILAAAKENPTTRYIHETIGRECLDNHTSIKEETK